MTNGRRRELFLALGPAFCLAACSPTGPPPAVYVLGTPTPAKTNVEVLAGQPVLEVKPVTVPDYLDISDILTRRGDNSMTPSPTGRWGERLSVGVTRALTQGLVRRLPGFIVTNESAGRPARQVLAEIETFEPRANGSVVLVAQWRVLDGSGRERLSGERVSLVEPIASSGDAATAAAMTAAIEDFADRVAAGVQRTAPATRAAAEARKHSHPAQR